MSNVYCKHNELQQYCGVCQKETAALLQNIQPHTTVADCNQLTGRVLTRSADGLAYTVTSCSTFGDVTVFDPRANEYLRFDSRETFENFMYGTPVSTRTVCAPNSKERPEPSAAPSPTSVHVSEIEYRPTVAGGSYCGLCRGLCTKQHGAAAEGERPRPDFLKPDVPTAEDIGERSPRFRDSKADRGAVQTALPHQCKAVKKSMYESDVVVELGEFGTVTLVTFRTAFRGQTAFERAAAYAEALNNPAPTPLSAEEVADLLYDGKTMPSVRLAMAKKFLALPGVAVVRK